MLFQFILFDNMFNYRFMIFNLIAEDNQYFLKNNLDN